MSKNGILPPPKFERIKFGATGNDNNNYQSLSFSSIESRFRDMYLRVVFIIRAIMNSGVSYKFLEGAQPPLFSLKLNNLYHDDAG